MSDEELSDREIEEKRGAAPETFESNKTTCSKCMHIVKPFYGTCPRCEGERNRDKVELLRGVIRELKGSISCDIGDRETQLVKELHDLGHPDVKGFMSWLSTARDDARNHKPKPKGYRR